jgi:3-methyladenine DNA glycosylase/8-oxoguanine DNA glycosylase
MMDAVLDLAGTTIAFDRHTVTLWPTPEQVLEAGAPALREKAKLGYRAERLVKAAEYLRDHPLSLRRLARLPEGEAEKALTAIPGIGKYSAAIIAGQSTPPIDAWSVVIMSELYDNHTPENSRQEIDRVTRNLKARWGTWSWLAFAYILNDIEALAREYGLSRVH